MKPTARLDSAVFQLTPTRTRFDLVITANGKTEKIATGLLNPFLAHLKTAQEQIAKGGYSISLEPEPGSDRTWFTKGTVERFVRFVSTPEILERVYTIESEILQIGEAIAIQGNNDMGLSTVEEYQAKPMGSSEAGSKPVADANDEKAIVLYKPDSQPPEANGSATKEGNSKVQLLKVLEIRKTVLQKEQGMAFARAAAAGFDIDLMAQLVSFAECFGASRLMDACLRFIDLWKRKHETGQWVEVEAAEAMSSRSEFSAMNASGIILSSMANNQNESHGDVVSEDNGQAGINAGAEQKHPIDHQVPVGQQEYFQSQFPHPMYPPWPIHSPPGALPVFQPYPGLPYYQNYPGNGPFYPPHYPPVDNSHSNGGHRAGKRRQSMDSRDGNTESEEWQMEPSKTKSPGDLELENESRKKAGRSAKRQSGTVVIRNINYIASKGQNSSGSESLSASDSDMDKEMMHKNSLSPKRKGRNAKSKDESKLFNKEGTNYEKETEGGNWQAFQNFLLKDTDERSHAADQGMFDSEKDVQMRRRKNAVGGDPLADWRYSAEVQDGRMTELHKAGGSMTRVMRTSNDEVLTSRGEGHYGRESTYDQTDIQYTEINGRKVAYRRNTNDDFMIAGRETHSHYMSSTDPLAANGFRHATNNFDKSSQGKTDESFIVPFRSMSLDQVGNDDRTAVDMDSELPHKTKNNSNRIGNQANYEPDELSLMPERGTQNSNFGYDPALDYEMQVRIRDATALDNQNKEEMADVKQGSKKLEKDRKSKVTPDSLNKKKTSGPIRKGKPSKLSPLEDARARAEKLRTYKADLQKMKKEKEEEDRKRLEGLKMERQKRIAARASSTAAQSTSSQPSKKPLPTKLSLGSVRGSKFSDSEPGSSSPLQRSKIRTATLGSNASQKASKISKSSNGSHMRANRMTRSASSLSEPRKESRNATPDSKPSVVQIRRLSEPKTMRSPYVTPVKTPGAELVSKRKVSSEPESKKISAIINLDRSKAATLPELKIRTSKESSDIGQNKSAPKEMTQEVKGIKSFVTSSGTKLDRKIDKRTHQSEVDDNPVIDKTIVMLECEKPPLPVVHSSEENMGVQKEHYGSHGKVEKNDMIPEYAAIHAPASHTEGLVIEAVQSQIQEQPKFHMVTSAEKEAQNSSSVRTSGKPYQAPYARLSSLEDPCTANPENGKTASTKLETETMGVKTQVSGFEDLKLAMIPESLAKVQVKESPKGFKRLLMFAKKNHSSVAGAHSVESDNASVDGSELDGNVTNAASSSEVRTLKNHISQDEEATSQKPSRNFSLLSPFRSKTSEKKLTSS
ncbi:hypothetical protein RHMOL_Rhmol04G0288900 [Rhododendron molle]|uniref:Uncharacterized protein n=1 Tax=Rhododendron molle TaxID=49168 RepID=A0ACC0P5W1_RHOML|nr:hypothetical protein RHMOL_Rhmol04G0288900 [Rhododendron molle]